MIFSILAARIDGGRKIVQESIIDESADKTTIEERIIYTRALNPKPKAESFPPLQLKTALFFCMGSRFSNYPDTIRFRLRYQPNETKSPNFLEGRWG